MSSSTPSSTSRPGAAPHVIALHKLVGKLGRTQASWRSSSTEALRNACSLPCSRGWCVCDPYARYMLELKRSLDARGHCLLEVRASCRHAHVQLTSWRHGL